MPKNKMKDDSVYGKLDRLEKEHWSMIVMINQLLKENRYLRRRNSCLEKAPVKHLKVENANEFPR